MSDEQKAPAGWQGSPVVVQVGLGFLLLSWVLGAVGFLHDPKLGVAYALTSVVGMLLCLRIQSVPPRLSFGRFLALFSIAVDLLAIGTFLTDAKIVSALAIYLSSLCVAGYLYDLARLLGHPRIAWLARGVTFLQLFVAPGLAVVGAGFWVWGQLAGRPMAMGSCRTPDSASRRQPGLTDWAQCARSSWCSR